MLCNECLKRLIWRFVSKDFKGHLLTINVKVTSDEKNKPKKRKVVQEKERNQKKNTQSLAGEHADSFPPTRDREVSPVKAVKVQMRQQCIFCHAFSPALHFYHQT